MTGYKPAPQVRFIHRRGGGYTAAMEIDLYQLPIPDWGIECPRCRYPLVGLPTHRCPECGLEFDMAEVVESWHRLRAPRFTGREDPFPDYGLDCGHCRSPLAGARDFTCLKCGRRFDPEDYRPRKNWHLINQNLYGSITASEIAPILAAERVPYLTIQGSVVREIIGATNVNYFHVMIPREFYFDALLLIRKNVDELRRVREHTPPSWRCAQCGESVPGNFDICWKCNAERPAADAESDTQ